MEQNLNISNLIDRITIYIPVAALRASQTFLRTVVCPPLLHTIIAHETP